MKLGYVCQYFTKEYRGPVTNLMSELAKEISVTNFSSVGKHMQYYSGGTHSVQKENVGQGLILQRYETRFKLSGLLFPKNLISLLSDFNPDIVQSEEYYQPATRLCLKWAKKNNKPLIINHRGADPRTRTAREKIFFSVANPLSKGIIDGASSIVCLSEKGRGLLCNIFPNAFDKSIIIPNSINTKYYSDVDGIAFREKFNIEGDIPLILAVARVHPQKRIDLLVKSYAKLKKENDDCILCIVGPHFKNEKERVDAIIRKEEIKDVIFTGPIPNEKVKDAYSAANIVCQTSEYEPFGYSMLEAMACQKPIVAFDVGAVSEIIEDGKTGYVLDFPDIGGFAHKLADLLSNSQRAREFGKNGLELANEKFNIEKNSRKLIVKYEELINGI